MHRLIAPAAVLAVLTLAGCTGQPAAMETTAGTDAALKAVCDPYQRAWNEFGQVADRAGRTESEMLAARDAMLTAWSDLEAEARKLDPTIADLIAMNKDSFEKGVSGAAQSKDYYSLFRDGYDGFVKLCG
ncbi:MAG: hypothetical protein LBE60_11140 [Microbacterium sp.]|jgi:hypothetical protein|uniref:hypothetical protein n=1 Tax=Microbacterium sp. TaxID=51671 RepID=UPI00281C7E90|nr:hypothetical protein [Microbacterium sp.]MDR2322188.1 hypothetical protein [Microbacterium sp.]